ncbi:MAG TPA: hypothetical protein VNX28_00460 [Gemmataceae bacterium]|jgi:hypothetical protein|nr:hypothetical protein [Gemmataceae bacterium]
MPSVSPGFVNKARSVLLLVVLAGLGTGCGGPARVPAPVYDPEGMARAAMVDYDKNGDGKLDAAELEACPALKNALLHIGERKRAYLTEEEIADRLRQFQESKVGLSSIRCRVFRDGVGLAGVTVTFVPEGFMGGAIKPGSGISDKNGNVALKMDGETVDGLGLGFYRAEASLKDASGKETLPAQYNKSTKLGFEVNHGKMEIFQINIES